jgi:hypothetical protein
VSDDQPDGGAARIPTGPALSNPVDVSLDGHDNPGLRRVNGSGWTRSGLEAQGVTEVLCGSIWVAAAILAFHLHALLAPR